PYLHPSPLPSFPTRRSSDLILVQISKDPVPEKGARLTSLLAFPGRLLVYMPSHPRVGVSRRIEDPAERERLQDLIRGVARDLDLDRKSTRLNSSHVSISYAV